ncbi:MAG: hypothetical protein Q8Q60_04670 [Candidatus Chromulinivorax sp.]|nr:hypothetical protein [Candidatus Chromulinivorax sp.]
MIQQRHLLFFALINLSLSIAASGPESLDTSFNSTGYLATAFTTDTGTVGYVIARQDDGKIVVGGISSPYGFVARYNNDGSADTTFNATGTPGYVIETTMSQIYALAIQPDGKIIVTGDPYTGGQTVMIRYLETGLVDTSFGTSGYVTTSTMTISYAIALQTDGKIVIAGTNNSSGIIMRYTTYGVLDTSFGASGTVTTAVGSGTQLRGVQLQTDGSIVAAGRTTISSIMNIFITRYTDDGILDTSFGTSGSITTTLNGSFGVAFGLAIQDDQKIIVVGDISEGFIARYTINGTLDTTFNSVGYTTFGLTYNGVTLQTNQQAIACGYIGDFIMTVIRYTTDGIIDSSCEIQASQVPGFNIAYSVAVQTDEKIITTGSFQISTFNDNKNSLGIARFLGGVTPSSGRTTTINTYGYNSAYISEFLYVDFYATVISNTTARAAAIDAVNVIIDSFATSYVNQPSFNFISYAYLMNEDLLAAEELLASDYPSSSTEIAQFFEYIFARETQLLE